MVQNKLKSIEDTICWINVEEALFKFPQSSYQDVGDVNVSLLDRRARTLLNNLNSLNYVVQFILAEYL